jgi:hypothetical protein
VWELEDGRKSKLYRQEVSYYQYAVSVMSNKFSGVISRTPVKKKGKKVGVGIDRGKDRII